MPIMGRTPSHQSTVILASLAETELHGYGIKKDVERRTGGAVRLSSTSLYRHLAQLLEDGLIREDDVREAQDDARRRYYRITPAGRRVLTAEVSKLEHVLRALRVSAARRA
jgi:DNA-binding PadR family transcriptional regulator